MAILAMSPESVGGLWLRARHGPVRERALAAIGHLRARRLHPGMDDETLMDATDLVATLTHGRPMRRAGLLKANGVLCLSQANACGAGLAGRLAQRMDQGGMALVALDESADPQDTIPAALADRMGLFVDLEGILPSQTESLDDLCSVVEAARGRLAGVPISGAAVTALATAAVALGIRSLRAPLQALSCARAACALRAGARIEDQDLDLAVALVFAHRVTRLPDTEDALPKPPPPADASAPPDSTKPIDGAHAEAMADRLIEAVRSTLPDDLLDRLANGFPPVTPRTQGEGAGEQRGSNRRGRPLPARPGRLTSTQRIDVVATLRAAAPWQVMRQMAASRAARVETRRVIVHPADLRLRRYQSHSDRVLIFVVDASGSQAMARMAEAKGAVELLLARAYARRDHAALIAFRDRGAELLLPPTRSLVQTKRRLAALLGGGPTPVAAGLQLALLTARQVRARGMAPVLVLLTDGRANIALDGTAGRLQAGDDAQAMARAIATEALPSIIIDTSFMPSSTLGALGREMRAQVLPLPRADAGRIAGALDLALSGTV